MNNLINFKIIQLVASEYEIIWTIHFVQMDLTQCACSGGQSSRLLTSAPLI